MQPLEIGGEDLKAFGRAIDGRHIRAERCELRCLAARCRAEVGDFRARLDPKQKRRQRRGRVLHPPLPVLETFKLANGDMGLEPQRAGRQDHATKLLLPSFDVGFDGQVERRFLAIDRGDRMGGRIAIGLAPARGEPVRRILFKCVAGGKDRVALACEIAQDGIDEGRKRRGLRFEPHNADGKIDRRVIRYVQKQDLRRGDDDSSFDLRGLARQAALQEPVDRLSDRTETPERDGDDGADEGAVARINAGQPIGDGRCGQTLVKRVTIRDDIVQKRRGGGSGEKSGMTLCLAPLCFRRDHRASMLWARLSL